jgi:hypothetical protein
VIEPAVPELPALLQALTPVETVHGAGLLVSDVETAVKQLTGVETISAVAVGESDGNRASRPDINPAGLSDQYHNESRTALLPAR